MRDEQLYKQGLDTGSKIYGKDGYLGLVRRVERYDRDLADYLVENAFGQVLTRPGLDLKTRMLCNVAALSALGIIYSRSFQCWRIGDRDYGSACTDAFVRWMA